jgi:large subunit ribosomal protein L23
MRQGIVKPDSLMVYDVIRAPVVTEKSTMASEFNKYTFKVATDATKLDIQTAVEKLYKVKVEKVNTINQNGKVKRFKGKLGKRSDTRKAIVTLAKGQTIDMSAGVK